MKSSGLTWAVLRDLKCGELEGAADGWGEASNRADAARDRIEQQLLNGLRDTQQGDAATAAVARLRQLSRNLQYVYTECGLLRTTLNSLAHELKAQQRVLADALDDAVTLKFTVRADGAVTYPAAGDGLIDGRPLPGGTASSGGLPGLQAPSGLVAPNPDAARAQDIADRVAGAVRAAAEIDWRYAGILRRLKAEEGLKVPDLTLKDAAGDAAVVRDAARAYLRNAIPHDASPAERHAWWAGLTQEQREEYLAVYPDRIGNLDGIPAVVRDAANRDNLQLLIGKLEGRDDERSVTQLAGLREIDRQLGAALRPGDPPMFLLGVGDEGNGRAIVSYGNPDTAKNVSAYVPGLNTSLDEDFAKNDLKRAHDTAIATRDIDSSSATIAWLGYDAPQMPDGMETLAIMSSERAEGGGRSFSGFMGGLVASNENDDPHMVAIGHSYGSRTVGAATQQGDGLPGVDDIILVGSPGVGVDRAEDLGVARGHVFVGAAENDVVTKVPSRQQVALGAAAGPFAYVVGDIVDQGDDDLWFGKDPASEAFGATRFKSDEGPHLVSPRGVSIDAHSQYFDRGDVDPMSADNIALIAAGKSHKIKVEEPR
ncbi:alpha/beta hydrolase family protein [Streptomyces clavifer]|uniref:alpha/beta hydrolase n=1 Tax=Streptomyces clavifer TaxID=68188 RepID=UPI002E80722E|nr:alpha/beta hydrolase [Streptomyces clavifer]WUC29050.1 alpha/beta hydrolase family protein [Streptomyces clavifer]